MGPGFDECPNDDILSLGVVGSELEWPECPLAILVNAVEVDDASEGVFVVVEESSPTASSSMKDSKVLSS